MSRIAYILIVLCLFSIKITAQNLVPNSSFENYAEINNVRMIEHWFNVTTTTDFFHPLNEREFSVPNNFRGYQFPYSGDGYAGIVNWASEYREYLGVKLSTPLKKDWIYEVSFRVNLSNKSQYASDDIGISFSSKNPREVDVEKEIFYDVKNKEGRILQDTLNWVSVNAFYRANGEEEYLLLGNHYNKEKTTRVEVNKNADLPWNYVFIDDVVVKPCESVLSTVFLAQIDTTVCEGQNILLEGVNNALNYVWQPINSVEQSIEIKEAGTYILNSYDQCKSIEQTFVVRTLECNCTLDIPSTQITNHPLNVRTSLNVKSYHLTLYDASGKPLLAVSATNSENLPALHSPNMYFWRAQLSCIGDNGFEFEKTQSGKVIVIDY